MHNLNFDARRLLIRSSPEHGASLPEHRRLLTGRTFDRSWTPAYGCAIEQYHVRVSVLDVSCWVASALLLAVTAWFVWG